MKRLTPAPSPRLTWTLAALAVTNIVLTTTYMVASLVTR